MQETMGRRYDDTWWRSAGKYANEFMVAGGCCARYRKTALDKLRSVGAELRGRGILATPRKLTVADIALVLDDICGGRKYDYYLVKRFLAYCRNPNAFDVVRRFQKPPKKNSNWIQPDSRAWWDLYYYALDEGRPIECALYALTYLSGLRIGECGIPRKGMRHREDGGLYLTDIGVMYEGNECIQVRKGKGTKTRYVPILSIARPHLLRYMRHREEAVEATGTDSRYFLVYEKGGRLEPYHAASLEKRGIGRMEKGLNAKGHTIHLKSHGGRKSYSEMLRRAKDRDGMEIFPIEVRSRLLGHNSVAQTREYEMEIVPDFKERDEALTSAFMEKSPHARQASPYLTR